MKVHRRGDVLVLSTTPVLVWFLGFVLLAGGVLSVIALGVDAVRRAEVTGETAGKAAVQVLLAAVGAWMLRGHRSVRTELDGSTRRGRFQSWAPGRPSRVVEFDFGEVDEVKVLERRDSDNDPMYQARIRLSGDRTLAVAGESVESEESAQRHVAEIRAFLRGRPAGEEPRREEKEGGASRRPRHEQAD